MWVYKGKHQMIVVLITISGRAISDQSLVNLPHVTKRVRSFGVTRCCRQDLLITWDDVMNSCNCFWISHLRYSRYQTDSYWGYYCIKGIKKRHKYNIPPLVCQFEYLIFMVKTSSLPDATWLLQTLQNKLSSKPTEGTLSVLFMELSS